MHRQDFWFFSSSREPVPPPQPGRRAGQGVAVRGDSNQGQTQPSHCQADPWWWGRSKVKLKSEVGRSGTGSSSGSVAHGPAQAGLPRSGCCSSSFSLKADPTGQRGTPVMASPQRCSGCEPLPTSPGARGPLVAASCPWALTAKLPVGEHALRALTWVFSTLNSLKWENNAFFQHCDVLLQCLCSLK